MAVQTPPYVLQNASHPAKLFRQTSSDLIDAEGVVASGHLAVTANSTPAMNVDVAAGSVWVQGDYSSDSGMYYGHNDAAVNLAIATADATYARIDLVIAQINDSAYSGSTDDWELVVLTGTASASPAAPTLPSSAYKLASIAVAASATTIVSGNITDERSIAEIAVEGAAHVAQAGAPSTTTDRLYNVGGDLYWAGSQVSTAGGDITGVAAGTAMSGGGTSGDVTLNVDVAGATSATAVATDYFLIADTDDANATKKALISDVIALGDITGVTAGTAMSGGGTSGTVTVNVDVNAAGSITAVAGDYVLLEDVDDNTTKKALVSDIVALAPAGDITGVTAGTAMSGGGTTGAVTVNVDVNAAGTVTAIASDYVLIEDAGDNSTKKALISDIVSLVPESDPIPLIMALS